MSAELSGGDLDPKPTKKPIDIASSVGPGTSEVVSMKEQVESSGRPTSAYEFAQGMVDYGRDRLPPPRIFLVYTDGRRETFTGKIADRSGIAAVEFTNSGGGLTPEDTTILHHEADKDTTLGQHGRGTTITLAYLESQGMHTEIESNLDGRAWKVKTSLEDTETAKTQVLKVTGSWLEERSSSTVFRVMRPTDAFLDQVDRLPEYFLPANPEMPDACIVEGHADAPAIPLDYEVTDPENKKAATVRCLAGVVPYTEEDKHTIYVDGLKVQQRYAFEECLFPWAIAGARDLSQNLKIARSSDSGSVDGRSEVVGALLQIALRHNEDPEIFTRLLAEAEELADKGYGIAPLELNTSALRHIPQELREFSEPSKSLLREVWTGKHRDAYVASSKKAAERFTKNGNGGTAVVVQDPMYEWLKEAGIATVEDVGVMEGEKVRTGNDIRVDYADDADRMEKLFLETGQYEGLVRVVDVGGRKGIEIRFPYSIHDAADFHDRHKPAAQLARVAAIIAMKENLEIAVRSQKASERADLEFEVREGFDNRFSTELEVIKGEGRPLPDSLPEGLTVITLSGESLQGFAPPRPEDLEVIAEKAAADAMRARAKLAAGMPKLQEVPVSEEQPSRERSGDPDRNHRRKKEKRSSREHRRGQKPLLTRRQFLGTAAVVGVGAAIYLKGGAVARFFEELGTSSPSETAGSLSGNGYDRLYGDITSSSGENQIGADYGGIGVFEQDYRSSSSGQDVAFEPGSKGQSVEGYYREFAGSKFVLDGSGRGRWISVESYDDQTVSVGAPREYTAKIDMAGVDGRVRLPIRADEHISAIDRSSSPVAIKREKRTRDYIVDGSSDRVVVYTTRSTPNTARPLQVESESILNVDSLASDWQSLLVFLQGNGALTNEQKAALVLKKWSSGFTYSADPKYDRFAVGRNAKQVVTQIVNGRHGICNYSATGMVGLLREAGVPARQVAGVMVGKVGKESVPHAWTEFWNGHYWVEVEPLIDSKIEQTTSGTSTGTDTNTAISGSAQSDTTVNLLQENSALLSQYSDALQNHSSSNEPKKTHQPSQEPTPEPRSAHNGGKSGGVSFRDIVDGAVGALAGLGIGALARRKKGKSEPEKQEE